MPTVECIKNVAKYQDNVEKIEIIVNFQFVSQNKISETYFNDISRMPKTYCHDFSSTETS